MALCFRFLTFSCLSFGAQECISQQDKLLKDYEDVLKKISGSNEQVVDLKLKPTTYAPISHSLRKLRLRELRASIRRKEAEIRATRREIEAVRGGKRDEKLIRYRTAALEAAKDDKHVQEESGEETAETTKQKLLTLLENVSGMKFAKPFRLPVSPEEVPTYASIIRNPTDLTAIKTHVEEGTISTRYQLMKAIMVLCKNATTFNPPDTEFYNSAIKLRDYAIHEADSIFGPLPLREHEKVSGRSRTKM